MNSSKHDRRSEAVVPPALDELVRSLTVERFSLWKPATLTSQPSEPASILAGHRTARRRQEQRSEQHRDGSLGSRP